RRRLRPLAVRGRAAPARRPQTSGALGTEGGEVAAADRDARLRVEARSGNRVPPRALEGQAHRHLPRPGTRASGARTETARTPRGRRGRGRTPRRGRELRRPEPDRAGEPERNSTMTGRRHARAVAKLVAERLQGEPRRL